MLVWSTFLSESSVPSWLGGTRSARRPGSIWRPTGSQSLMSRSILSTRWRSTSVSGRGVLTAGVPVRDPIDELGVCHGVFEGQAHTGTRRGALLFPDLVQEGPMRAAMGKERFLISACPSCGSPAIRKVKGEWTGRYKGMSYTVGALEYYACSICQEKVYPPEAMHRIQEASPAYSRPRRVRRTSDARA